METKTEMKTEKAAPQMTVERMSKLLTAMLEKHPTLKDMPVHFIAKEAENQIDITREISSILVVGKSAIVFRE